MYWSRKGWKSGYLTNSSRGLFLLWMSEFMMRARSPPCIMMACTSNLFCSLRGTLRNIAPGHRPCPSRGGQLITEGCKAYVSEWLSCGTLGGLSLWWGWGSLKCINVNLAAQAFWDVSDWSKTHSGQKPAPFTYYQWRTHDRHGVYDGARWTENPTFPQHWQ